MDRKTFKFSKEVPFVGFTSYSSAQRIHGLSLISFKCTSENGPFVDRDKKKKMTIVLSVMIPIAVFVMIAGIWGCCRACDWGFGVRNDKQGNRV